MSTLLKGKPVADSIYEKIAECISNDFKCTIPPGLALVRVGDDPSDIAYENSIVKAARKAGISVELTGLETDATTEDLLDVVKAINESTIIDGCLIFRPLSPHIDEQAVFEALLPSKDIDGATSASLAHLVTGKGEGFAPATAEACIEMCKHYDISLVGKKVVVVGRSLVIGKPVALLALDEDATVTICHSKTEDIASVIADSDIAILATGKPKAFSVECFNDAHCVIDVGISVNDDGKLCGDVDFDSVVDNVDAITPVPGGIGSLTCAVLLKHVLESAMARCK